MATLERALQNEDGPLDLTGRLKLARKTLSACFRQEQSDQ